MSHPMNEHRAHKVERERVSRIGHMHDGHRKHRATGGSVHGDEAEDKALIRKEVKGSALKHADGKKPKHRADKARRHAGGKIVGHSGHPEGKHIPHPAAKHHAHKHAHASALHVHHVDGKNLSKGSTLKARARGGGLRKPKHGGKTNVNVIVAPGAGKPPMGGPGPMPMAAPHAAPPAAPMGAAPPPPPMPPKPPMPMGAAGGMPPGGGPGLPPGQPPMPPVRAYGGRAYKKGGAVHDKMIPVKGAKQHDVSKKVTHHKGEPINAYARGGSVADKKGVTGIGDRTPIQHSGNKSDSQNIGRGPVITRATGGPIYADGREGKQMGPDLHAGSNSGVGRREKAHLQHPAGHEAWNRGIT